uniref:Circularly permutated Ras protein 1-like n=1 Tax=Labrus bergylta TaxID=56723 RepID=A0A3Q3MK70_9LABR
QRNVSAHLSLHVCRSARSDDDYQNLEDTLVVFCVDISGSMSVTTEVCVTTSSGTAHISRLQSMQDALQRALTSLLQQSPHRRVALVTFNDDVVIYGDGTSTPLALNDWALVDYDHIWQQSVAYSIPHCIAETYDQLMQRVKDLSENGATCLGPAVLASVAMASRYPGSKVLVCLDRLIDVQVKSYEIKTSNIVKDAPFFSSRVIISVMTFEGTDCRLADIGRLADTTGGRQVNMVSVGTVATEIQSASNDNVVVTGVMATLLAPDGMYFPYEDENNHKVVRDIGNVTKGLEITIQFAVKPELMEGKTFNSTLPFQVQLSFKTRDQQQVTRIITEQRPVTTFSRIQAGNLNTAVLGVHCAQLCARLTMDGRVQEAQRQLKAHQVLINQIRYDTLKSELPLAADPTSHTHSHLHNDLGTQTVFATLSDEAANVMYQMKRASSANNVTSEIQKNTMKKKKKALME